MLPGTLILNSIICSTNISPRYCFFFFNILPRKNWRGGGGLLFRVGVITNRVIALSV